MQPSSPIRRYVLVPGNGRPGDVSTVRRFSLARVAISPQSALGVDRFERLEQVAWPDEPRKPGQ
jgi:hypothetical protein